MISKERKVVVNFENVNFVRDARTLLENINFTIQEGQRWALLGPNGSGKSTLLNLCGALKIPSSGKIEILGHTIGRIDIRQLRESIGHVNPSHNIQSVLDVKQVIFTGLTGTPEPMLRWTPSERKQDLANDLIDTLGLNKCAHSNWQNLSQGERMRTLIARALICEPKLLLLDEPCSGLDVGARENFLNAIDDMHKSNAELTTIVVTHHLEELPSSTTNAMLLKEGQIVDCGSAMKAITSEKISTCFSYPVEIVQSGGRWHAQT